MTFLRVQGCICVFVGYVTAVYSLFAKPADGSSPAWVLISIGLLAIAVDDIRKHLKP